MSFSLENLVILRSRQATKNLRISLTSQGNLVRRSFDALRLLRMTPLTKWHWPVCRSKILPNDVTMHGSFTANAYNLPHSECLPPLGTPPRAEVGWEGALAFCWICFYVSARIAPCVLSKIIRREFDKFQFVEQSKKKYCHSEEPSGDEESPKITLVLLLGGSFVALLLRMTHIFWILVSTINWNLRCC